jgi:hypothetical protein
LVADPHPDLPPERGKEKWSGDAILEKSFQEITDRKSH